MSTTLTEFPTNFFHFNTIEVDGVSNDVSECQIQNWIEKVKYAILTEGKPHSSYATGNCAVIGLRYGSSVEIYVMKNYHRKTIIID